MVDNGTPRIDGVKLTPEATAVLIMNISEDITEIKLHFKAMEEKYVSKEEFSPVKSVVYGLVGVLLVAVISGVVAVALRTGSAVVAP